MTDQQTHRTCPTCEGSGEICPGQTKGTYWTPPEPLPMTDCPVCKGSGEITRDDYDNWCPSPPSEDEAAEMLMERIHDRAT